jgi:hypothetical protein
LRWLAIGAAATGCAYHPPTGTTGGVYELRLDMDKLAAISIEFFGTDNAYYVTRRRHADGEPVPERRTLTSVRPYSRFDARFRIDCPG